MRFFSLFLFSPLLSLILIPPLLPLPLSFPSFQVMVRARENKEGPPLLADPVAYTNFFAMGTCIVFLLSSLLFPSHSNFIYFSLLLLFLRESNPCLFVATNRWPGVCCSWCGRNNNKQTTRYTHHTQTYPTFVSFPPLSPSFSSPSPNIVKGVCKVVHESLCRPAGVRFTDSEFGRGTPLWSTTKSSFILFSFLLFYFILFYFILFYFILFYFIFFYFLFFFFFFSFLFFSFLFFSFLFFFSFLY